ncbi:GNAT family N-acetyltransferase [Gordonia jinhuaensis]|uniref:ElaA protein n=1 Tax=Gordonia jinhuaensis TaxID=1517702 RepID=A0A916T3S9_9ACTN|nr:GNAT family N-acetyltransferase [Gordonia jinhuaensis]GGB26869.1 ElaA protein [Gordonia jinhuaensis]
MTATAILHRSWALDLDTITLYDILKLRQDVFVVEQSCPYEELDGRDLAPTTRHLWLEEDGQVICTLRLLEEYDEVEGDIFRIGRLCTERAHRGQGHTTRLLRTALAEVGPRICRIHAQSYLVDMYAKHGFRPEGPEYLLDGIPHVPMIRGGAESAAS